MMEELRRLWCLLDTNSINLRARYIISTANVWADKLIRHLDSDEWRLDPVLFVELDARFGRHSIDRIASALNTILPRYNAGWRDVRSGGRTLPIKRKLVPRKQMVEPSLAILPNLVHKLRHSGATATVVAPRWTSRA
jgi:hypothetical protein